MQFNSNIIEPDLNKELMLEDTLDKKFKEN